MKNYLLPIICLAIGCFAKAQFPIGQKLIGAQIGANIYFSSPNGSSVTDQRSSSLFTSFSLSRFKSPTLLNGFGLTFSFNNTDYNVGSTTEQTNRSNALGFFVSSTKLQTITKKFYLGFTGTSGLAYGFGKTKLLSSPDYTTSKNYNIYVSGGLGLFYQLNQRWLLSTNLTNLIGLSYTYAHFDSNPGSSFSETNYSNFTFNSGLSGYSLNNMLVGVRYLLK